MELSKDLAKVIIQTITSNLREEDIPSSPYWAGDNAFRKCLLDELKELENDDDYGNGWAHIMAFGEGLADAILKAREDENK